MKRRSLAKASFATRSGLVSLSDVQFRNGKRGEGGSQVWQAKRLREAFLDVWQRKELQAKSWKCGKERT